MATIPGLNLQAPSIGATKLRAWILFGNGIRGPLESELGYTERDGRFEFSSLFSTFHRISLRFSHCSHALALAFVLSCSSSAPVSCFHMQSPLSFCEGAMVSQAENAKVADARGHCDDCPGPQLWQFSFAMIVDIPMIFLRYNLSKSICPRAVLCLRHMNWDMLCLGWCDGIAAWQQQLCRGPGAHAVLQWVISTVSRFAVPGREDPGWEHLGKHFHQRL